MPSELRMRRPRSTAARAFDRATVHIAITTAALLLVMVAEMGPDEAIARLTAALKALMP